MRPITEWCPALISHPERSVGKAGEGGWRSAAGWRLGHPPQKGGCAGCLLLPMEGCPTSGPALLASPVRSAASGQILLQPGPGFVALGMSPDSLFPESAMMAVKQPRLRGRPTHRLALFLQCRTLYLPREEKEAPGAGTCGHQAAQGPPCRALESEGSGTVLLIHPTGHQQLGPGLGRGPSRPSC